MSAGGVTQAATLLRTSQPTVSREVKDLERLLRFPLFIRKGRHLLPTEAALALHAEVRRSYVGLEEITRAAEAIRANASAHISVACLPAYSTTLLPAVCQDFLRANPSIRLSIHSFEQTVVANGLATHHYDLGIVEVDPRLEGLTAHTIDIGEEMCVVPKGHPLAEKKILKPCDFEGLDFIYFSAEDAYRRNIDTIFQEYGVRRRLRVEATTATSVCALVAQGLGVSIINPISALHCRGQDIELRRFSIPIRYLVGLYGPTSDERSDLSGQFLKLCAEALVRIKEDLARLN
jgi:DNA-binding transcriptional LysR family regulator